MATTKYGSYVTSSVGGYNASVRVFLKYTVTTDDTYTYIEFTAGINDGKDGSLTLSTGGGPTVAVTGTGQEKVSNQKTFKITSGGANSVTYISTKTWKWERTDTAQNVTVTAKLTFPSSSSFSGKKSTASLSFDVPASSESPSGGGYVITYNANGGYDAPDQQTKAAGETITISSVTPSRDSDTYYSYTFNQWRGSNGTYYMGGDTYSTDADLTLAAQWTMSYNPIDPTDPDPTPTPEYDYPPTFEIDQVVESEGREKWLDGFSKATIVLSNIDWKGDGCETNGISVTVGSETKSVTSQASTVSVTMNNIMSGTDSKKISVKLTSTNGQSTTKDYGYIIMEEPTWDVVGGTGANQFYVQLPIPTEYTRGNSDLTVEVKNYTNNTYEKVDGAWVVRVLETPSGQNPKWTVDGISLDKNHVSDQTSATPDYSIRVSFNTYTTTQKEYRRAFFATTKNALFTSGLANNIFVSGCTKTNYSSRAWYSYPNDPLYFPDTNYVEVGANDTAIMGMIKCGEYLAVVKQAKPTDTSIYMLYPTSYDDNTTYAIRQSISGNGSQSRFSFNVLNDEALFLSPEGITAIVLSEDNQHKLQNRSYYINKPLLKESGLEDSFSFIYDGMYLLSVPKEDDNGNKVGKVYVLDGNQMTSWETAKTNLQYEAYIWEGVTAWCMMRYNNQLWFSDKHKVYRFKTEDVYNKETGENSKYTDDGTPVKATWSTIMDNDGATNYYKSLQKRGNVITLSGEDLTSARVYFQKDEDERILVKDIPTSLKYEKANPTQSEFNAHKEWYFVIEDGEYVKCIGKTYDQDEDYYILDFEVISGYPIDIFTKKKMKKYKRLQISIENDRAESFGVREIVKTYTIGNFSKR